MEKATNFAKEFKLYENLFSNNNQSKALKEDYEVQVEGESRMMPDIFYDTAKAVNAVLSSLKNVDAYDNHYFNGESMHWESMWNIFEPITFDIDELEKKLETLVSSKNTSEFKMDIYFDRDMLEEDDCLNISLTLETDLVESLQEESASSGKVRTAAEIQAEIDKLQQELRQAMTAEKSNAYNGKFPTELYAWDMYLDDSKKGTWCSVEKDGSTWEGRVFETEADAFNAGLTLLYELSDEDELRGEPEDYTIATFSIPITELTVELLEESDLEHLIPAIIE